MKQFLMSVTIGLMATNSVTYSGEPTQYVEETVTFGFHSRGVKHWAGAKSASCAGTTNLQNPLNDKVDLVASNTNLRVNGLSLSCEWEFTGDGAYYVKVDELRDVRGTITLDLYDKAGNYITSMTSVGAEYNAYAHDAANPGAYVKKIKGTGATTAATNGNAGGHAVVETKSEVSVDVTAPADTIDGNDSGEFSVKVSPPGLTVSTYKWTWKAPDTAGNDPQVDFATPNQSKTTAKKAHWFAPRNKRLWKDDGPQCEYTINCEATIDGVKYDDPTPATWPVSRLSALNYHNVNWLGVVIVDVLKSGSVSSS